MRQKDHTQVVGSRPVEAGSLDDQDVEAGHVDGASSWQMFREITWPQIVPVAVTVLLIRAIEAFKIVDLPNIMTGGGPGSSTESMTRRTSSRATPRTATSTAR